MLGRFAIAFATTAMIAASVVLTGDIKIAAAQDMALDGSWESVGGRQGARAGISEHDLGQGDAFTANEADDTWTLTIEQSRGRAVHGEWCSPNMCEDLVGVESASGEFYAVDHDGIFIGTVLGNHMELCYLEPGEEIRVADCHMMAKR